MLRNEHDDISQLFIVRGGATFTEVGGNEHDDISQLFIDSIQACASLPSVTLPECIGLFIAELIFNSNVSEDRIHNAVNVIFIYLSPTLIHSHLSFADGFRNMNRQPK